MTPVAGLLIALIAAWVARGPRRATIAVISPWSAVLLVQTWSLGTGQGNNPASTISDPTYWIVQLAVLALALGVALAVSDWRSRRARSGLGTAGRVAPIQAPWRDMIATVVSTAGAGALALAYVVVINPVASSARQTGHGEPPLYGLTSIVACIVILIVSGGAHVRARRLETRGGRPAPPASSSRITTT